MATKSGVESSEGTSVNRPITFTDLDNLGEATASELYDGDGVTITTTNGVPDKPSSSLRRARSTSAFDELGRPYRSDVFSVDSSTGAVASNSLETDTWYNLRGLVAKVSGPNVQRKMGGIGTGGLVDKFAYDGAGRLTTEYVTDGRLDTSWSDALNVTGDTVLQQDEYGYDANDNVLTVTDYQRFHNATIFGAFNSTNVSLNARRSFVGYYYDKADRLTAAVDVGTNGGSVWNRPASVPPRSDTVLVTDSPYNASGWLASVTDPKNLVGKFEYDNLGRTTKTIENYVDGTVSDTDDKTVVFDYGPAGLTKVHAKLTGGGEQVTENVYGIGTSGQLVSNDIVGKVRHPDRSSGAASDDEREDYTYNRLGELDTFTDRPKPSDPSYVRTIHKYGYDVVGRPVSDAVTQLGTGRDGAVKRIETAYDGQGNPYLVTSYDAATAGTVVNQVQRDFNGLGQLTSEWQEHGGTVSTSTTPSVQYAYSFDPTGVTNHSRLTALTYPNGRVLHFNYDAGLDDSISRLSSITQVFNFSQLPTTITFESYDYLGVGTVVRRAHPQPGVDQSYIKVGVEANGEAGDQYTGLDRFGRVIDQRWLNAATFANVDRYQYGYDRDGNRTSRTNVVNSAFNETYGYDGLNQLTSFARGSLSKSWDYDALGNWHGVTTNGSTDSRSHNKQNQITSVPSGQTTPTYDSNGNQTKDLSGLGLKFDAWDRLVEVDPSGGGAALRTYKYDGLGRRIQETAGGTTTDFYYSAAWQVLEERVGGATKAQYIWSPVYVDALIRRDRDADGNTSNGLEERLYATQDANFNVTGLVNTSGAAQERYLYDPYGSVTYLTGTWGSRSSSSYNWVVNFQGLRADAVANGINDRNREEVPTLGREGRLDPIGFEGRDFDLYRSFKNRPEMIVDPSGLLFEDLGLSWLAAKLGSKKPLPPAGSGILAPWLHPIVEIAEQLNPTSVPLNNGYYDLNGTFLYPALGPIGIGISGGLIYDTNTGKTHFYIGPAVGAPAPAAGISLMYAPPVWPPGGAQGVTPNATCYAWTGTMAPLAWQVGVDHTGTSFGEFGIATPGKPNFVLCVYKITPGF